MVKQKLDKEQFYLCIFTTLLEYCYLQMLECRPNCGKYFVDYRLDRYADKLRVISKLNIYPECALAINNILDLHSISFKKLDGISIVNNLTKIFVRCVDDIEIPDKLLCLYNLISLVYSPKDKLVGETTINLYRICPYNIISVVTDRDDHIRINKDVFSSIDNWDDLFPHLRLQIIYLRSTKLVFDENTLVNTFSDSFIKAQILERGTLLQYKTGQFTGIGFTLENVYGGYNILDKTQTYGSIDFEFVKNIPDLRNSYLYKEANKKTFDGLSLENFIDDHFNAEASDDDIDIGDDDLDDSDDGVINTSDDTTHTNNIEDPESQNNDDTESEDVYLEIDDGNSKTKLDDFIYRSIVARMNDSLQRQTDPNVSGEDLATLNALCKYWLWKIPTTTTKKLLKKLKLDSGLKGF